MNKEVELNEHELQEILLNHVILPRVLPQKKSEYIHEETLVTRMLENVERLKQWIPSKTVECFERLKRIHLECTPSVVSDEIDALCPGDTFAMFVHRQNCAFMIYVPPDNLEPDEDSNIIVSTFPGSLHPKEIYKHASDIEFTFPVQAIEVTFSQILRSEDFANQLCYLHEELPIDSTKRNYVSKWLVTLLTDQNSTTISTDVFPIITKKIRDESLGETKNNFFRRSNYYMCLKVLLQHSLTMQLGPSLGKFLYKIVMLKFMVQMCAIYKDPTCLEINIDLLSQMIAKLGRRIEKLSHAMPKTIPKQYNQFYNDTIDEVKDTIKVIGNKIDYQIEWIQRHDEERAQLRPLTDLNFEADIYHEMPKLQQYLHDRSIAISQRYNEFRYKVKSYRRYYAKQRPSIETIEAIEDDLASRRMFWTDFEIFVLYHMKNDQWTADEMRSWLIEYAKYGEEMYNGNPVLTSRMMLVHLKLIHVLDRRATREYPLLEYHRSGINANLINSLLLPQRIDMEIAHPIEKYFRRRNEKAIDPSLIEEKMISDKSFSVKFAKNDDAMKELRKHILILDEKNIQHKRDEWKKGRERVEQFREEANRLECKYMPDRFGQFFHSKGCERCWLRKKAHKEQLKQYERLLPRDEFQQFAVVFELRIPDTIACLRDILYGFTKLCAGNGDTLNIKCNWIERPHISAYNKSTSQFFTLGSTKQRRLDFFHVDEPFNWLIVPNSCNCLFHVFNEAVTTTLTDDVIKCVCTFKTQDEYIDLQWTLDSTEHTQNHVLSRQIECPQNLSLSEYKNFGSLRSDGNRLKYRKLYAMIETEALSFEKESVLCLIMQTLWECGVSGDGKSIRESHFDLSDPTFCSAMIELIKKFIEQQRENWMHPFKLLMATLIAVRAFEINDTDSVADEILEVLMNIRIIVLDWISKIEGTIRDMNIPDEIGERELRLKLMYVSITGGFTFFVHPKHKYYDKLFEHHIRYGLTAFQSWLHFIITLKNNMLLYESSEDLLPSNLLMFLRLIEISGVYLEPKMTDLAQQEEVYQLVQMHWSTANYALISNIHFDTEFPHTLIVEASVDSNSHIITIDIINGLFLIGGCPVSRLPAEIMQHEDYQRYFGNTAFEVQPNAQNHFSFVRNDRNYEFQKINNDNYVIITERSARGVEKELIPFMMFRGDFSNLLVANYSHWWDKQENCIEFRQRAIGSRRFVREIIVDYRLDLATHQLIHVKTKRFMLDIKSGGYKKLAKQLSRLEHPKYIHILMDEPQVASVELLRMKLKFKVDCRQANKHEFNLESNEFSGMCVSRTQKIGTLYGLNHGLVLESCDESSTKEKIVLMPNGDIHTECTDIHISVDIETKYDLKNPPFYQYQVDEFCRQLKSANSSHSSWFYLAYLHAVTSHGEIEPFTGMSGTERALQILQSAFAWSTSPYEPEAVDMLNTIANLSPIRKINECHQIVTWPNEIPPRSAQDSFVFIVKKLLDDSQRLHGLHSKEAPEEFQCETDLELNERDYRRCLQFNPNLRVSDSFVEHKELRTALPDAITQSFSSKTQTVSVLYHKRMFKVPPKLDLIEFLTTNRQVLKGLASKDRIPNILFHSVYEEFADLWICLYEAARNREFNQEQFALIWSLLAHKKENIEPILALQTIAMNPNVFEDLSPPSVETFPISAGTYNAETISTLLRGYCVAVNENADDIEVSMQKERFDAAIADLTEAITRNWPCDSVNLFEECKSGTIDCFDLLTANEIINMQLIIWNTNRKLLDFIDGVQSRLKSLRVSGLGYVLPQLKPFATPVDQNWKKFEIDYEAKIRENLNMFEHVISQAKDVWEMKAEVLPCSANEWWIIIEGILKANEAQHLARAGLYPRTVPSCILPKIISEHTDDRLKALIGAWAIAIAREQRQKRIKSYSRPELKGAMDKEIENEPHTNWKPSEYPEWLLFEIEQNLTIRWIQVEIAKRMIEPPETSAKHSVMQLNMGEGKTAVIVPILAAVLADGTQACQITVLKSLFTRNLKSLRQHLGGLLNRRIYTFPCRRDMPITRHIEQVLEIYEECKMKKGVILTLPEYRLSLQLKIYESIQKQDIEAANNFLNVHKWINTNVRNILDESDAILQANYQLIYTVGNQLPPDSGSQRWFVTQALLKRVPYHMKILYEHHGEEKIEFDDKYIEKNRHIFGQKVNHRSDVFTPCRILDDTIFEQLKTALIEDFFNGQLGIDFQPTNTDLKDLLTGRNVTDALFQIIKSFPEREQNTILILSGLLRFEVLKLVLTKRWRVNYGVDTKGHRKMAIPFKAKDVAAEMVEFGHPDVAICFTQMSYYYSGLTDAQLHQLFDILENKPNAMTIYEKWIESISPKLINHSIRSYTGINLDNPHQRDKLLFPLLRFNMHVIDFWLANVVFQYEAKIFEKKLMCTTWDLCSDRYEHRVTGFSGTNDTKNILPLTIAQNDLEELENTNESMRQILLLPENQSYESLPANVSGKQILEQLAQQKIPVLLDSGALMLELTNEQVAVEWLKMTPDTFYDTAIYFDSRDILQTIDRNGTVTEFDCSVHRENLNRCLVYLDDMHTRGTDLKFPLYWKACVTLSGDITRDKTVQSCMRMRQLGTNHSICFWASYEADIRIRKLCNLSPDHQVTNENVIKFICNNSRQFEKSNMVHWTAASLNYTKKLIGHKLFENSPHENSMENLYGICVDDEFVKLIEMYGDKEEALLTKIAWSKFNKLGMNHMDDCEIISLVQEMQRKVFNKLKQLAPDVKQFSHAFDEEQEKELEQEQEEQRNVERPPAVKPATPNFNKIALEKLIVGGVTENIIDSLKCQHALFSMNASLTHTELFRFYKKNKNAWFNHLLVTKDFQTVIDSSSQACDEFLRPVWWIGQIKNPNGKDILILLSSYECDRLLPVFRKSIKATLHMYRPRLSKCHSNLMHDPRLKVTGMEKADANDIDIQDEIQIGMYAGMMYFNSELEQNAYCGFLGLIPRPRTRELEYAFKEGVLKEDGFVPVGNRRHSEAISNCVSQCKFQDNPIDLAIKLIEAHHQTLLKESHVASILERNTKLPIQSNSG